MQLRLFFCKRSSALHKGLKLGMLEHICLSSFRLRFKCDGTCAETRFRLSAKGTSPFKQAGASVQSTTGSRRVRISGSNAGYNMFRGSVQSTGYPLHSQVSPSIPLLCVTACHHISTGLYQIRETFSIIVIELLLHSFLQNNLHYTLQVITPNSPHTQLLIASLN